MNSALKPVLPQPGVPQPGGQPSPAKGNVATVNHAVGHPQGAQNSLHHGSNNLVGQNLTHHAPPPPPPIPPHAVPSMAPVSANMAQMAQNMSHHGNLSHVTQNSVAPPTTGSPSKPTTSPLSLVQDKVNVSQPLALTRTPEKKEPDSTGHANGTIDSMKPGCNTSMNLKPQNPETNNDKQDIAKTSPSTPKPPEKPTSAPTTPQKVEQINPINQVDVPVQPKVATANEMSENSPSKLTEFKPPPTADVTPSPCSNKPLETANASQIQEKPSISIKQDVTENVKTETKLEDEQEEVNFDSKKVEENKEEPKVESLKEVEPKEKTQIVEEKVEEKKMEPKLLKVETKPKSTLKLATVTPPMRKRRQISPNKDGLNSAKKLNEGDGTPDTRMKRNRTKVQLYQSPTPELAMATKLSASAGRATPTKPNDDKLIVFYKNEYLAVRNAEGGFYVCQAMQNVYRTTRKIKIRWLSQDKSLDPSGETYKPDFYDVTDMECVLTTLSLSRAAGGGGAQVLKGPEQARANSILQRALRAERSGTDKLDLTEEHPDGLDLSLYTDESQLEKKSRKRNSSKSSPRIKRQDSADETEKEAPTPVKKARTTPKRSPKSARKTKTTPTPIKQTNNKRKSSGSTPLVAATSKTATAVAEKPNKSKSTPTKRTPTKQKQEKAVTPAATPTRKGRRAAKDMKSSPVVATPSTSTGKTTRTPRKPPAKK